MSKTLRDGSQKAINLEGACSSSMTDMEPKRTHSSGSSNHMHRIRLAYPTVFMLFELRRYMHHGGANNRKGCDGMCDTSRNLTGQEAGRDRPITRSTVHALANKPVKCSRLGGINFDICTPQLSTDHTHKKPHVPVLHAEVCAYKTTL